MSFHNSDDMRTILFSVIGLSPAVLTETVYALAHSQKAIVPDNIIVLTTIDGKERIVSELLSVRKDLKNKSIWQLLRETIAKKKNIENKLMFDEEDIIVFKERDGLRGRSLPIEDICLPAHNLIVADTIVEHLRRFTEDKDTRIFASIAGGRKTMSALLFGAMTLLGRIQDKVFHVLINEPFDNPDFEPKFYFPHPLLMKWHNNKSLKPQITLAEIPFVPIRHIVNTNILSCSYSSLINTYLKQEGREHKSLLSLDEKNMSLNIDGKHITLRKREWHVLKFLISIQNENLNNMTQKDAAYRFLDYIKSNQITRLQITEDNVIDVFKISISLIRKACRDAGVLWGPGLRQSSLKLPPFTII